jgi:hypothetical protein
MPAAPQRQALEVVKQKVMEIDDRYEGYRAELVAALHDILSLERNRPHNIKQQVSRRITALGEILVAKKGRTE